MKMNLDIKNLTKEQLVDLQSQIEEQLNTTEFIPKGTICYVWDNGVTDKPIRVANGKGKFYCDGFLNSEYITSRDNYEVIHMGISFSDEVITSEQITPEMNKCLALCWDSHWKTVRDIKVIDSKNKCTYSYNGERDGYPYNKYQLCTTPIGNLPQYYRDMIKACEE